LILLSVIVAGACCAQHTNYGGHSIPNQLISCL